MRTFGGEQLAVVDAMRPGADALNGELDRDLEPRENRR